ncbi:uncharacterized protein TRIADDRAFT_53993 [Trichoplax adhaerens]|uniref:ornithine decarboxylase n=1 Tax=Trichoplax adhaerens TaxID=10228 RepID=B3RML7_TRIAD|nr:hypothetical protein TRIADDRAFT_53993 [Trichoplax adhaerens]EDV28385.1 hypothetical protein TRIADDRAFT_53993 [Trichoplax adhaerens]|eukprot:XP_002110219.1 hypothetical protein TRIADDRAFT_53993 [Trichoplax adhaerens]
MDLKSDCFHVGSDCLTPIAYEKGIITSKQIFKLAEKFGYHFNLLDIGGGFTAFSALETTFAKAAAVISKALQKYFPPELGVRIIAEPDFDTCSSSIQFNNAIRMERVEIVPNLSLQELIEKKTTAMDQQFKDDSFMLVNIGNIIERYREWKMRLPNVEPFYAVKCNNDPVLLRILINLGVNFDCASMAEMQLILDAGVHPDRIVYANTIKAVSHLRFAKENNINHTVFDNEDELHKIKKYHPNAKLALRICPDMKSCESRFQLGIKFGAPERDVAHLLKVARSLSLDVMGVSFHVGSDCLNPIGYEKAIIASKKIFKLAEKFGYHFKELDIGGGFTASSALEMTFEKAAVTISKALQEHFPPESGVRIIAEPGRFFPTRAYTIVLNIIGKRVVRKGNNDPFDLEHENAHLYENTSDIEKVLYYVNESVYGSIGFITLDPTLIILKPLNAGDWIYFEELGAYSLVLATEFNSFKKPKCFYYIQEEFWNEIQGKIDLPFDFYNMS